MLDMNLIMDKGSAIQEALMKRGESIDLKPLIQLSKSRRKLTTEADTLKRKRNLATKEIGKLKKAGQNTIAQQLEVKKAGSQIASLDAQIKTLEQSLRKLLLTVPNIPHASVPKGKSPEDNVIVRSYGKVKKFDFTPKTHIELGKQLGILDFGRGAKMSRTGFPLYIGKGAKLERALIQFMLDLHTSEHGYLEVSTPFLCNSAAMTGTGQLPKMADDMYHLPQDDLYLIPTAEVPVTNIFREEIIGMPLPVYLVAYSPCFRREAGAAGHLTRGLIRVHQFDKVELVKFVAPHTSCEELEKLVSDAEDVLKRLNLTYRVKELCAGDLSFASAKCYDIELYAPGQNDWLEVSSCSNFEAFQARRAAIRYRTPSGQIDYIHTLNGSGVALARLVVALLESNQQADGSVTLPEALVPYMNGIGKLEPGKARWTG